MMRSNTVDKTANAGAAGDVGPADAIVSDPHRECGVVPRDVERNV